MNSSLPNLANEMAKCKFGQMDLVDSSYKFYLNTLTLYFLPHLVFCFFINIVVGRMLNIRPNYYFLIGTDIRPSHFVCFFNN